MKKLMVAAAIVCAAAGLQAATILWGNNTEASGLTGEWANEGAWYGLYMLSGNVDASAITELDFNSAQKTLTVTGGTATLLDEHTLTASEYEGGSFTGEYKKGAAADLNGKYYTIVLFDESQNAKFASAGVYTISGLDDAGGGKSMTIGGGGDATEFSQTGTVFSVEIASVPEPTSGLLLLLGVAGLALKRRRA